MTPACRDQSDLIDYCFGERTSVSLGTRWQYRPQKLMNGPWATSGNGKKKYVNIVPASFKPIFISFLEILFKIYSMAQVTEVTNY